MNEHFEQLFPRLCATTYRVTSPTDESYNCIAWAAGDTSIPWWPVDSDRAFWPVSAVREETLEAFCQAFVSLGYAATNSDEHEPGFEKVAIFINERGAPTHAARQLSSGLWTSKLGVLEDIEHALRDLEGAEYGVVVVIMKRPAGFFDERWQLQAGEK